MGVSSLLLHVVPSEAPAPRVILSTPYQPGSMTRTLTPPPSCQPPTFFLLFENVDRIHNSQRIPLLGTEFHLSLGVLANLNVKAL